MIGKLIFLACVSGVHGDVGDIGDIDCNTSHTHVGKLYCGARREIDGAVEGFFVSFYCSNMLGWFLVIFSHVVVFAQTYALSESKKKAETNVYEDEKNAGPKKSRSRRASIKDVDRGAFHRLLKRSNDMDDIARLCRLLGQNLLAYWAYFGATRFHDKVPFSMFAKQPFIHCMVITFIDNTVLWAFRRTAEIMLIDSVDKKDEKGQYEKGLSTTKKMWDLKTIYALPSQGSIKVGLIWLSQTVLFGLYCLVMNESSELIEDSNKHDFLTWILGVLVMCTVGEKQSGDSFDFPAWGKVLWVVQMAKFEHNWGKVKLRWRLRGVYGRGFADWTVNSIYRQVLLNTTPVLLCTEGPLDFIKDVLAIAFISALDDVDDDDIKEGKLLVRDRIETCIKHEMNFVRDVEHKVDDKATDKDDTATGNGQYGLKKYLQVKLVMEEEDTDTSVADGYTYLESLLNKFEGKEDNEWDDWFDDENTVAAAALWLSSFEMGHRYGCLDFCQEFICFPKRRKPEYVSDSGELTRPMIKHRKEADDHN